MIRMDSHRMDARLRQDEDEAKSQKTSQTQHETVKLAAQAEHAVAAQPSVASLVLTPNRQDAIGGDDDGESPSDSATATSIDERMTRRIINLAHIAASLHLREQAQRMVGNLCATGALVSTKPSSSPSSEDVLARMEDLLPKPMPSLAFQTTTEPKLKLVGGTDDEQNAIDAERNDQESTAAKLTMNADLSLTTTSSHSHVQGGGAS